MKARPILFSGPMVQALVDGRKTQTRRVVKGTALEWLEEVGFTPGYVAAPENALCPYGVPGDLLIVRETHWRWGRWRKDGFTPAGRQRWRFVAMDTHPVAYCLPADRRLAMATCYPGMDRETVGYWKRPSLFMPRKASRLTLEITDVGVERLQGISQADAKAEGLFEWTLQGPSDNTLPAWGWQPREADVGFATPVGAYRGLWKHINGPDSWDANPWVWIVEFKVHRANVDQVLAQLRAAP